MSDDEETPRPKRRRVACAPPAPACAPAECEALERALPEFFKLADAHARDVLRLKRAVKDGDIVLAFQLLQVLVEDKPLSDAVGDDAWLRVRERYFGWLDSHRAGAAAAAGPG